MQTISKLPYGNWNETLQAESYSGRSELAYLDKAAYC